MKTKRLFSFTMLIIGLLSFNHVSGQISQGGIPYSFKSNLKRLKTDSIVLNDTVPVIQMPEIDPAKIDSIKENNKNGLDVFQFAYGFEVSIDLRKSSIIDSLESGLLFRLSIKSTGAFSINVIFKEYNIPPGAKLFLYNKGKKSVKGAFTSNNNIPNKKFPIEPVIGDEIILEYFEPYFPKYKGTIIIGKVSHDFLGIINEDGNFGNAGDCHVDINCPEGDNWQNEKRAVCRILINGSGLCSGTLLNNTNLDGTPYFLTANHCINNQYDAENSIFVFNYESPSCNGSDGSTSQSISGADLRATRQGSDFTLLELSKPPISTFNPFYAGWDRNDIQGAGGVCIHHPAGDVKKISTYNMIPINSDCITGFPQNNFYLIDNWQATANGHGVTEGGSSGSPLFNNNHQVIGQLFGGCTNHNENCTNPANDFSNYGKIFSSWDLGNNQDNRLQNWLDPVNNTAVLNGSGICNQGTAFNLNITHTITSGSIELHQAIDNIEASNIIEPGATATYEAGNSIRLTHGFHAKAGCNFVARLVPMNCVLGCYPISIDILPYAFTPNGDGVNDQLCYPVSNATSYEFEAYNIWGDLIHSSSGLVTGNQVCVWDGNGSCSPCSYVVIIVFRNDCDEISEAYTVTVIGGSKSVQQSNSMDTAVISDKVLLNIVSEEDPTSFDFEIFPNPSKGIFSIRLKTKSIKPYKFEIFSSIGKLVYSVKNLRVSEIKINKSCLPPGIYYVRLNDGYSVVTKKIVIQ
ncbi:MAG: T9SS type A sorting domain-containing protein [Bacteroidia bacterium]|nr:T9SS type A sorting domain-containing protein [Bacteroidia bacterium]